MDVSDNADRNSLLRLAAWHDTFKSGKLSAVPDSLARNFLAQLLNKQADLRPTPERCSVHPFLTGKSTSRMPGENPEYDVYLSNRASDAVRVNLQELV